MKKAYQLLVSTFFIVIACSHALAAGDLDLIVTSPDASKEFLNSQDPNLANQEFQINYNSNDFSGEVDTTGNKNKLLASLLEEMKIETIEDKLFIPRAPDTFAQLQNLSPLTEFELQSFLGKKQKFLQKLAKVLLTLHLKPKFINKVLAEANSRFYDNAKIIVKSNTTGGNVMLSLNAGLALPKKLVEKLQHRPIGRFIPKSGGFSYLVGLGISLSRRTHDSGRTSWVLDVYVNTERLRDSLTGMIDISASANFGMTFEMREGRYFTQKSESSFGGATGVFRQGATNFGWDMSAGINLVPGLSAFLIYTNKATRHYIFRLDTSKLTANPIAPLLAVVQAWMKATGFKTKSLGLSCSKAFQI